MAIDLPTAVSTQVEKLQLELDKLRLPIKWEKSSKLHLTLAFLGKLDDSDIGQVRRIGREVTRSYAPFRLQPAVLDTLYQRHEPSLVYLLIANKDGDLDVLQKELAKSLSGVTPQPQRKFLAHVTIGRVLKSDPTHVKQSLDKLSDVEIDPLPEFDVWEIGLYESFVTQAGGSFQRVDRFILGNKE